MLTWSGIGGQRLRHKLSFHGTIRPSCQGCCLGWQSAKEYSLLHHSGDIAHLCGLAGGIETELDLCCIAAVREYQHPDTFEWF